MRKILVIGAFGACLLLSACASDQPGYAAALGYGSPSIYYDGFYGPIDDGYWGPAGFYYFRDHDGHYQRDDGHHFRTGATSSFHSFTPRGGAPRGGAPRAGVALGGVHAGSRR
jgi:hypothetical protein